MNPELPPDLLALADQAISHRDELYQLSCKLGQWFCRRGYTEDECAAWLIDQSPLRRNYSARQFEYQITRAVEFIYETHDPAKRCGERQVPADPEALRSLMESVSSAKVKHKKYTLLLIQHAINEGVSPVYVTARQLAALAGAKNWSKANDALVYLERTLHPEGIVTDISRELVHYGGHSYLNRAFTLNERWEGYINTMHDTYVSLSAEQAAKAKLDRAERQRARKAEQKQYDREYELRMRRISEGNLKYLKELDVMKQPAPDPFTTSAVVYPDPFADAPASPSPDTGHTTPAPDWPDPDLTIMEPEDSGDPADPFSKEFVPVELRQ